MTEISPAKACRKLLHEYRNGIRQIYRNPDALSYSTPDITVDQDNVEQLKSIKKPKTLPTPQHYQHQHQKQQHQHQHQQQQRQQVIDDDNEAAEKNVYERLIKDTYHPGVLEDSIKKNIDFNNIVVSLTKKGAGDKYVDVPEPISLVEAFHMRLKIEEKQLKKCLNRCEATQPTETGTPEQKQEEEEDEGYLHHREGIIGTTVLGIDLHAMTNDQPNTELIDAINCLQKAERLNDYDRAVLRAEAALQEITEDEKQQLPANQSSNVEFSGYKIENMTSTHTVLPGNDSYKPLEILSYVGLTKPLDID